MTISSHGENTDPLPDGDPDRLRRLSVDDIFHLGSFALWAGPILAFLVVLLVIQDYAGETVDAADRASPRFRSRDHVHYSYAANIIVMLYSTLSYASWATFLRLRNVRHAELYAVTGWLLARVVWWLTLPIFGHVFMQIYADRLHMFGGGWGILAVSLLAAAGALRAIAAAYKGETTTRVWSNLGRVNTSVWICATLSAWKSQNLNTNA